MMGVAFPAREIGDGDRSDSPSPSLVTDLGGVAAVFCIGVMVLVGRDVSAQASASFAMSGCVGVDVGVD